MRLGIISQKQPNTILKPPRALLRTMIDTLVGLGFDLVGTLFTNGTDMQISFLLLSRRFGTAGLLFD
jgi:hypothetical protein